MKIAELFGKGKTVFSCEVFPPKKDSPVDTIYQTLDGLKDIKPDFISVTFGAGGSQVNQSTREIAAIIQKQYHIPAMAQNLAAALGEKLLAHLDNLQPARTCPMTDKEREIAREWFLLTTKPVIYACNIKEDDLGKDEDSLPGVTDVKAIAAGENAKVLVISAKIEEDIAQMDDEEKDMFLEEMGIGKSGLDRLIAECYDLLGLISFLTAGADECRAWTIRKGTKAPQAAGKIHSDFERGFIRAEIVSFDDLKANGSMTACKEKGLVRSEGKEYVMQDGDVTLFRFNV